MKATLISRRLFICGCLGISGTKLVDKKTRLLHTDPTADWTITIPAKKMKNRVEEFKNDFIQGYLHPGKPYPVFSMLYRSGLLPEDTAAEKKLGSRGVLTAKGNVFSSIATDGASLELPYHALLNGQQIRISVKVPPDLKIKVTENANGLTFDPLTDLLVNILDDIQIAGLSITPPKNLRIAQISIQDSYLSYLFTSTSGIGTYLIRLDLTTDQGDPTIEHRAQGWRRDRSSFLTYLLFSGLLLLSGCVNNLGGESGNAPYTLKEVCYTDPAPVGYIRIDSKAGGLAGCPSSDPNFLNVEVYADYSHLTPSSQLLVCSDAPIPTGWEDMSGSYHDETGCDARRYSGTKYANVRLIKKQ